MARHHVAVLAGMLAVSGAWVGLLLPSAAAAADSADLVVQPPTQSGPRTFSVDALNNGPQTAQSVVLQITGLGNYQVLAQSSDCQQTGSEVVCSSPSWEDTHLNGVTEHFEFTFNTGSGPVTLTASVSSATPDPDSTNNSATSVTWTPQDASNTPTPTPTATGGSSPPVNPQPPGKPAPGTSPAASHRNPPGTAGPDGRAIQASASPSGTARPTGPPLPSGYGGPGVAGVDAPLALANGDNQANEVTTPPDEINAGRFAGTVAAPILFGTVIGGLLVARGRRRARVEDDADTAAETEQVWLLVPDGADRQVNVDRPAPPRPEHRGAHRHDRRGEQDGNQQVPDAGDAG